VGAGALSLPAILAACGGSGGSSGGTKTLYFENWPEYIDEETVALFKAASGIAMTYSDALNDNNEYFAKVSPLLSKGSRIDADLIAPTFWMASRFIQLGWAQKLPLDRIPNASNLRPDLVNPSWDPNGEYSLPWQTGVAGIAYNIDATGREITSVEDLFAPDLKGRVAMLTEMRDTIGLIAMGLGIDISKVSTFDEVSAAFDKLDKANKAGQVRAFTGNDYLDDLNSGNFAACVAWSGDVLQLSKDNPSVRFVIPEEGGTSWYDSMIWVKGSENSDSVAAFLDYVYDPVNAARITASVQYISPVVGVQEELAKSADPEIAALAEDPLLFPDDATLARLQTWGAIAEEEEAQFDEAFSAITGA
jgi:spermidine/putrescine transport system substrate-binding protein